MATTDAKAGFRLPWSSDRSNEERSDDEPLAEHDTSEDAQAVSDWPTTDSATAEWAAEPTTEAAQAATETAPEPESAPVAETAPAARSTKKPSKFLADLTKAMQTAAEEARSLALSQLQAEAKSHVELIHTRSATEAASLRRSCDDDVAAIREWSKAEIARIREETETRITDRKGRLESEIESHAGVIEREIEGVQARVAAFEAEMAVFFERLLAEDDPTRFATMAENLPEPPPFDTPFEGVLPSEAAAAAAVVDAPEAEAVEPTDDAPEATETTEAVAETVDQPHAESTGDLPEIDREAAFAAIQAAAEAAASAEVATDAAARAEAVADIAIELVGHQGEGETEESDDPRVAALGLTPDYDAAEAEAYANAEGADGEEIPVIEDDALAARLAGLVPGKGDQVVAGDTTTTQVIVVGLVSVASIASFKRHLGRLAGVSSVGVSSGPDGEFIFAVTHGEDVVLREVIPSLPSFQARVTGSGDGTVNVTAHDPEAEG